MPGYNHPGGLPPRPPTAEEIEAAKKKVVAADKRNAERLAEVAIRNTKRAFKVTPPAPKPQLVQAAQATKVAPKPFVAKPAAPPAQAPKAAAPAPPAPQPSQTGDLPKDEGEEEVFSDEDEKALDEVEGDLEEGGAV